MKQGNGWVRCRFYWPFGLNWRGLDRDMIAGTPQWKAPHPSPWLEHGPGLRCFRLGNVLVVQSLEDFGRRPPQQVAQLPSVPYSRS